MWTLKRLFRRSAKPSRVKSPEWLEVWAVCRYDLQLSEQETWELSWEEYEALLKRRELEFERQNYHAALVCSVIANVFRDKKQRAFKPADFMPSQKPKRRQTPEQMIEIIKGWQAFYGKSNG